MSVVCALAAPTAALAAIVTWDGGAGTNSWHDAANWSANTLPAAGDDVVLPTLASSYTVVHSTGSTSVAKVDVSSGATLRVTGGTLTLTGAGAAGSTVAGTLALSGGTIAGVGDVRIDALFQWFAGTMQGSGTTTVAAGGRAELYPETPTPGAGTRTLSRVLANFGTVDYQDGPLTITATGQLDNFSTGEVLVSDGTPFICSSCAADAIANGGTITKDTGSGIASLAVGVQGPGDVRSLSGTLQLGAFGVQYRFTNTGEIDPGAGQVQLVNVELVDGTAFARSGANVRMSASSNMLQGDGDFQIETRFQWFGGTMQGAGTTTLTASNLLELFPETPSAGAGTRTLSRVLANFGTVDYQDGPLTITSTGQLDNWPSGEVLVSDGNPFVCAGCAADAIANGGTITKNAGTGIASLTVGVQGPGTVRSQAGTLQLGAFGVLYRFTDTAQIASGAGQVQLVNVELVDGTTQALTGANVRMSASSNLLQGAGDLELDTTFQWFAGTMQGTGSTTVLAGRRLELFPETMSGGAGTRTLSRRLANFGTVKYQGGPLTITATGQLDNFAGGEVLVSDGTPFVCSSCPSDAIANGGTITKETGSGIASIAVGAQGPGDVRSLSGTLQLGAFGVVYHFTDTGEIDPGAGQVQLVNADVVDGTAFARAGANVRMSAGSNVLAGDGNFQIEGVFQWFAGTMQGAGTTHVAAGGRIELFPETPTPGTGTRTLSRPLTNSGTVDYQDGPLTITSTGNLNNQPTGEVLVSDGTPFSCTGCPADAITNGGTITKDSGSGISSISVGTTGPGRVRSLAGTLQLGALGVLFRFTDNAEIASGAGQVQLLNVEVVGGTAFARSGANVRMSAGSNVLQGAGNLQIEGVLRWFAGTMQGAGTTHVAAGGRIELLPESPSAGAGTRTLSRPLTNSGTVDYQDGPLTITSGGQFTNNAGGLFLVSDGSVLSCSGCAGSLLNAGTIHKDGGTGTAVLDVPLTNSGTVHAEHGIVRFAAYAQTAAGTMRVRLGGTTVGTGYTRVAATGAATLAGTLDIVTDSGFTAAEGDTFQVMTFASRSGTFGTIVGGPPVYTVQHNATDVTVTKPLANNDPVANANGPYAVDEGGSVGLTGSGSDADGDALTYAWDLDNNGTFETTTQNPTFSAASLDGPTTATVVLRVCDPDTACDTDSATIDVANVEPSVNAGADATAVAGSPFTRSGSFTDPGPDTWTATVDYGEGAGAQPLALTGTTFTLTHVYAAAGTYTVTVVVTDDEGGAGTDTFLVTVTAANSPPTANAGPDQNVDEGSLVTLDGTASSDPDGDSLTYAWTQTGGAPVVLSSPTAARPTFTPADNGTYTFRLVVHDGEAASAPDDVTVNVANVPPSVGAITAPADPVRMGSVVTASAPFTDPGSADTHTSTWTWGDGSTSPGTAAGGTATGTHAYTTPGVYTIVVVVRDDDGGEGTSVYRYVVVYDPAGGFVTGGGWFNSPAGAYSADPTLTGRANFGFVSKYRRGADTPSGETQFQFHAGSLDFDSTEYEWLVVAGARAMYKGIGTINGAGRYGFMLSAVDGERPGGGGADKFRIKIWDDATGVVVYDNQRGAADDAEPTTTLGGGSIVVRNG